MVRHIEDNAQMQVVAWFRQAQGYKLIPAHYHLVHNNNSTQGLDTYAKRNNWKKRGGLAGLPDLVLYGKGYNVSAIFIEMKAERYRPKREPHYLWYTRIYPDKTGKETTKYGVTSTQSQIMNDLIESGFNCFVCFSADDAVKLLEDYLGVGRK